MNRLFVVELECGDDRDWVVSTIHNAPQLKKGQVTHEGDFIRAAKKNFTLYYQPMVPWVNRLRKAVFPNGGRWENEDNGLYARMKEILEEARKDPAVAPCMESLDDQEGKVRCCPRHEHEVYVRRLQAYLPTRSC